MSHISTLGKRQKRKILQANRGVLARVARNLDPPVSAVTVSEVFWGRRTSKRVTDALDAELAAIESKFEANGQ